MLDSLIVRNSAYSHHARELLTDIWQPVDEIVRQAIGFGMTDALAICDSMTGLVDNRLRHRHAGVKEEQRHLRAAVKRYRQRRRPTDGAPMDLCQDLAAMRPSEAAERIRNLTLTWFFFALGELMFFDPRELADKCHLDVSLCEAFLQRMSLTFGELEPRYYRYPSAFPPLMLKPLIRYGERFFLVDPNLILNALRLGMEALINPGHENHIVHDPRVWERYENSRSKYLEKTACQYLADVLKHADVYRNLSYQIPTDAGTQSYEIDGLAIMDTALFLIECKAGTVSVPMRRGAPERMLSQLEQLVVDPWAQALRAKRYIESNPIATFTLPDERVVDIDRSRFSHVFLITVTLDYLEAYVTDLYDLSELDIVSEDTMPWAVSLTDLRVISELAEFPSQFVHYLMRRRRLNELALASAHDELDWFGHYLREGLYFHHNSESVPKYSLLSYTTDIDSYYFHTTGARKTPAPKPSQPMPDTIREILQELEDNHPQGYLNVACALLDMDQDSKRFLADGVRSQRAKTLADGELHDFSVVMHDAIYGFTFLFAPSSYGSRLLERLRSYCILKKYQLRAERWYGLGCFADLPEWAPVGVPIDDAWKFDAELEEMVANMLPTPSDHVIDLRGSIDEGC